MEDLVAGEQVETGSSNGIQSVAASRAATLAALEAGEHVEKAAPDVEKKDDPAPEVEVEETDDDAADDDESESDDAETEADDKEETTEAEADEKPADKPDADLTKRLAQVQKAEKRSREVLAKERADAKAEFDQRVAQIQREWGPRVEKAEAFEKLAARARVDSVAVLRSLGLTDEDLEAHARAAFAESPAGKAKPEYKEAAQRLQRERERDEEIKELKKWRDERTQQDQRRDQTEVFETQKAQYIGEILKGADESPLLKSAIAKNATKAHRRLWSIAEQHFNEHGEMPTPDEVATAYEKQRREELDELGIEAPKAVAKKDAAAVVKKDAAAPVTKKKAADAAPKTLKEQREETRRLLEEGKLD